MRTRLFAGLLVVVALLAWLAPAGRPARAQQTPTATVRFSLVNLYLRPSQSAPVVGTVVSGETCRIDGRDEFVTWLMLDCGDRKRGWIDRRLVTVSGDLNNVLILEADTVTPPPAVAPTATPTPRPAAPPRVFQGWRVAYYNNPNLQGSPVAYEDAQFVSHNWGNNSPHAAVPVDYFSAQFERTLDLAQGYYQFNVSSDDGVRVWLDGELLIDEWHGATGVTYTANRWLGGRHVLRIEYLELVALASIRFWYDYSTQSPVWQADYYTGAPARGNLLYSQREPGGGSIQLDRNWGFGSPVSGRVPADNWNGRWSGQFYFEGGNYLFRARADDGVRVYIDQTLVIDGWTDGYREMANRFLGIGSGNHLITVDYYKKSGAAMLQVWWYRDTTGPGLGP